MPPPPSTTDDSHQKLLDQLDMARTPRPFRNPHWKPSARRNKNVKQILSETSRKEASVLASQNNSGASTPFAAVSSTTVAATPATDNGNGDSTPLPFPAVAGGASSRPPNIAQAAQSLSTLVLEKNFRSLAQLGNGMANGMGPAVTYTNIESAPSLHPSSQKRYCDITGLPAPYTDPKTRLRYHDKEVFAVVRSLGQGVAESYLEVRGANVVLKYGWMNERAKRQHSIQHHEYQYKKREQNTQMSGQQSQAPRSPPRPFRDEVQNYDAPA